MNDLDLFSAIGAALYGPHWQSEMARALDVNIRTVQRWAAGTNELSPWVWDKIPALVVDRQDELAVLQHLVKIRSKSK